MAAVEEGIAKVVKVTGNVLILIAVIQTSLGEINATDVMNQNQKVALEVVATDAMIAETEMAVETDEAVEVSEVAIEEAVVSVVAEVAVEVSVEAVDGKFNNLNSYFQV